MGARQWFFLHALIEALILLSGWMAVMWGDKREMLKFHLCCSSASKHLQINLLHLCFLFFLLVIGVTDVSQIGMLLSCSYKDQISSIEWDYAPWLQTNLSSWLYYLYDHNVCRQAIWLHNEMQGLTCVSYAVECNAIRLDNIWLHITWSFNWLI